MQIQTDRGLGSGVVFDDQGDIVTNAHVVASAQRFRVTAARGKRFSATLVGASAADDLAVIRAENANLTAASFGRSADLKVGDIVLAIGNPLGLRSSVTEGIVSALGRRLVAAPQRLELGCARARFQRGRRGRAAGQRMRDRAAAEAVDGADTSGQAPGSDGRSAGARNSAPSCR